MSIEAMKQALEALGSCYSSKTSMHRSFSETKVYSSITSLRQAIAEAEKQEPVAWLYPEGLEALKAGRCWTAYGTKQDAQCSIPIYDAVAPRVEPPVTESGAGFESLPASQEPVAWRVSYPNDPELGFWFAVGIGGEGCLNEPLYTSPPQRQPLTDEQKDAARWAYIRKHWKTINFKFNKRPNTLSGFTLTVSDKVNNDDAYLLEKEIDDAIEAAHGIKGEA